jgi:hypothetical protein
MSTPIISRDAAPSGMTVSTRWPSSSVTRSAVEGFASYQVRSSAAQRDGVVFPAFAGALSGLPRLLPRGGE